jgi:hypothetical protein
MKRSSPLIPLILITLMAEPAHADRLPILGEQPWAGYFVVHPQRKFNLAIKTDGSAILLPIARREMVHHLRAIQISVVIRETLADGRSNVRSINANGFETKNEPTMMPTTVTYSGISAGKGRFEMTWRFEGDTIRVSGRMLETEKLKNPMTLSLRVKVPDLDRTRGNADSDQVDPRAKRDLFTLTGRKDRQRMRPAEDFDPRSLPEGDLQALTMKSFAYFGHEITFSHKGGQALGLATQKSGSLLDGFEVELTPDPAAPNPPELLIQVR